ncbi:bifunctional DNA-formamidopyrimidine glycosylase/DNA-(apurinic or apyrimidinic site) lyase [Candidatus Acetothermia bacterium]|nr:bifunctional DNA-formamidopyrimidine glycosylase/DNA-(apurinic or apyrimidinic site) lyase [Candidatus Acetothermia bacterium]MBI3643228.1 bifunctional DNA-formamidopyrimidine glycosylase/DNA-(apurinic or apyrimidinic site) lyase [Candidatus Acetothermia bacterium]
MPELPEVETIRQDLEQEIAGKTLRDLEVKERLHLLKNCSERELKRSVVGQRLIAMKRRGKYLLFCFEKFVVVLHLRMSGRLLLEPAKHTRLILEFEKNKTIYFDDARRFGALYLSSQEELEKLPALQKLGIEPFSKEYSLRNFRSRLNSRQEIKRWLLDQSKVTGVGNIYACEALFEARIGPEREASSLSSQESKRLFEAVLQILRRAIEFKGTSIESYRMPSGELGNFQKNFKVYGRLKEPCHRCHGPISRITQGGRSTYFCRACQS